MFGLAALVLDVKRAGLGILHLSLEGLCKAAFAQTNRTVDTIINA